MIKPDWMKTAERVVHSFGASTRGAPRATHSVYVVLLHDGARGSRSGLYVGQTSRDPDWRFDQHMSGYKASSVVRKYGISLLPNLYEHLNPMLGWESLELEAGLAEGFQKAGIPWVEGGH